MPRGRWYRRFLALVVLAAIVTAALHGGHSHASALSLAGISRSGDTFQPQAPPPGAVSKAIAIGAAVHFAFGQAATHVPSGVRTRAYFGLYSDTIYRHRPVWIVRFWGPGLDLEGSGGGMPLPGTPYCAPPVAHEELVVVDGKTGKYLEGTVGLIPTGLPTVVTTPEPVPTPCPARPPHPLTPWAVAMGAEGNLFLGGYGLSGYREHSEVQKRSTAGRLLFSFSTQKPHSNGYQITSIALDTKGDVFVADDGNQIQKFGPNGRLLWQWFPLGHRLPQTSSWWNLAVARNGTVYVAGARRGPTYVLSPAGRMTGTRPGRWSFLAVGPDGTLYAANIGHGLVQAFSPGGHPARSWHMRHNPGQAIIDAIATGSGGSLYVLDERVEVAKPFYEVVRYSPAGRVLRRVRIPQGPGMGQLMEPRGLTVGPNGTIYLADSGNPRIVIFTGRGRYLGSWTL
jgi:sugar lactone lactonase YvrE